MAREQLQQTSNKKKPSKNHVAGRPRTACPRLRDVCSQLYIIRADGTARTPSLFAATRAAAYLTTWGYTVPRWNEAMSAGPAPSPGRTSLPTSRAAGLLTCPPRPAPCCPRKLDCTLPEH